MVRGSLLVLLAVLATGCTNYRSRGQGPFADRAKKSLPPPPALPSADGLKTPPAPNRPGRVVIEGSTQIGDRVVPNQLDANPTPPAPPTGFPGEASPVPPRSDAAPVVSPQVPRPPAVPDNAAVVRPQTPAPAQPAPPAANPQATALAKLAQAASRRWATIDTLEAKLTRREAIGGARPQTEEVLLQVRREPYAVYMRNTGEVGRGREVLYNPSKHDDKVHAIVGEGDSRLYKAGNKAPSLSPDSPLVKSKSRRSIRDAGPGTSVALFARLVQTSPADLKYVGAAKRPEFGDHPLELVEQTVRGGAEPEVERGGLRSWYFDAKPDSPSFGLPVVMTLVETGSAPPRELEFYCYTQVKAPAGLTDADFDVARLGRSRR
ncbi:DUF1571 domain-containing protein [bacterium]|nr:DUF1571 domain-containing protein [bacterium]